MLLNEVAPLGVAEVGAIGGGAEDEAADEEDDEGEDGEEAPVADPLTGVTGGTAADTATSGGTMSTLRARPRLSFCQVTEMPLTGGGGGTSFSCEALSSGAATGIGGGEGCLVAGGVGGAAGVGIGGGDTGGGEAGTAGGENGAPHARQNFAASSACCPHFGQNFISRVFSEVYHSPRRICR